MLFTGAAHADSFNDVGQVVSVRPAYQEVTRQVCDRVQVQAQGGGSSIGIGSILGGLAGGLLGNQIGGGSGRTIATAAGAVAGAFTGNSMENQPSTQTVCRNVSEQQQTGFDVQYKYNGQVREALMNRDPGSTVNLSVQPY